MQREYAQSFMYLWRVFAARNPCVDRKKIMNNFQPFIDEFKQREAPDQSSIALAGTGPNGAIQVQILNALGSDYLQSVKDIHVISGGAFSLFIYISNLQHQFNVDNFKGYERFVEERHRLSLYRKLSHLATLKFSRKSLYPNTHIKDTFRHLFSDEFGALRLKDLDYPVTFYSYDLLSESVVALNRASRPDMALVDVARACISVPPIHGYFEYQGARLIDPIFSPGFGSLRKTLFRQGSNLLFVNHKKTRKTPNIYFLSHGSSRYPDIRLFSDFALLYLGVPNRRITQTNLELLEKGIINGL